MYDESLKMLATVAFSGDGVPFGDLLIRPLTPASVQMLARRHRQVLGCMLDCLSGDPEALAGAAINQVIADHPDIVDETVAESAGRPVNDVMAMDRQLKECALATAIIGTLAVHDPNDIASMFFGELTADSTALGAEPRSLQ